MANITKKLGMSDVWNAKSEGRKLDQGQSIDLCRIIGQVTGTKLGNSQYGDFVGLQGMFEVQNVRTGEVKIATTLYAPEVVMGYLTPAQKGDVVKFAIEVYAEGSDKSPVGFAYGFRTLIEAQDPLAEMRAMLTALPTPTLEAPKNSGKKTAK